MATHKWTFSRLDVNADGDGTELHWQLTSSDGTNEVQIYGTVNVKAAPAAAKAVNKTKAQILNAVNGMITAAEGPGWKAEKEALNEATLADMATAREPISLL